MNAIRSFFDVIARGRTYRNIAYVWLAFPLGLFYFVFMVTGSALSVGLSLLWIGVILGLLFILTVWSLAQFERLLSKWLLDEPLPLTTTAPALTFWQTVKAILNDWSTWKGALFLLLKFPIGLFGWVASVTAFALSAAFIVAPFAGYRGEVDFGRWIIQDPTGGWLLMLFGLLLLFPTLHLHNAMGAGWRLIARTLLEVKNLGSDLEIQLNA
jgi:hypothetical protein